MSRVNRLSENAKFKKSGVAIKGLMTLEFAKTPILGQPVKTHTVTSKSFNEQRETRRYRVAQPQVCLKKEE